jgi:hypothetical protein
MPAISSPSKRIEPDRGGTRPLIVRSRDVLPAPFAPSTAVRVPGATDIETPSTARTAPYAVTTVDSSSTVAAYAGTPR